MQVMGNVVCLTTATVTHTGQGTHVMCLIAHLLETTLFSAQGMANALVQIFVSVKTLISESTVRDQVGETLANVFTHIGNLVV